MERATAAVFGLGVALLSVAGLGAITALGPQLQISDLGLAAGIGLAMIALHYRPAPADGALCVYLLAAGLSAVGSPEPRRSLVKLLGLGLLCGLYLIGRHLWSEPRTRRLLAGLWLAGAALASLLGIAGVVLFYLGARTRFENPFIAAYGSIPVGDYARVVGLFANPNMFCSYLVASLAVIAAAWPEVSSRRLRAALAVLAGLLVVNAALTLSVGLGGLALGAGLWWFLRRGRGRHVVLGAGAIVAAGFAALMLVHLVPRGQGDLRLGPWDVEIAEGSRVDIWRGALRTAAAHPLAGKGYGTLVASTSNPRATVSMEQWGTQAMAATEPVALEAHDVWLNVLGQTGIPGLLAFAIFIALVLRGAPAAQPAIFCGLVATLLYHGLFAALEDARHLWLLLGMAAARPRVMR